jgi:hypothetical protein
LPDATGKLYFCRAFGAFFLGRQAAALLGWTTLSLFGDKSFIAGFYRQISITLAGFGGISA